MNGQGISKKNRIFVNRSLNFGHIRMIGFDMDHTLARYNKDYFENLAFKSTLSKLIESGYPEELALLNYRHNNVIRGLMVDKVNGNVLKVDSHKYVKEAHHGYQKLSKEQRHALYNSQSFNPQDFQSVDTFFGLSEVQLFSDIVDYMRLNPGKIQKSFEEIYKDLRWFIDLSHRDGSIKDEVLKNPQLFIESDKYLAKSLIRLIDAGKKLFLLTNSHFDYTNAIMKYLFESEQTTFGKWQDYWTFIIVGASKPGFFNGSHPFYEVIEESGLLRIHDTNLTPTKIYHGGNAKLFESQTGIKGDEILYVGDHIYGDIIQSKGFVNWRTMLVIPELEEEFSKLDQVRDLDDEIGMWIEKKEAKDEETQKIRSLVAANMRKMRPVSDGAKESKYQALRHDNQKLNEKLKIKIESIDTIDKKIKELIDKRTKVFHPIWGELMKVGLKQSRFAHQVLVYACLYSSCVSNMRFYSPYKKFLSFSDRLPHES